jgi:superkiller protein 3
MEHSYRKDIAALLAEKETEELLEIWQDHNIDEWDTVVFEILEEIFQERLGFLPPLSPKTQCEQLIIQVVSHMENGDWQKALLTCNEAIQIDPDSANPYHFLGIIYDELKQPEKALINYQKAVTLDPELEDAWLNLLCIEEELGEEFANSNAKQHLDQALAFAYDEETDNALAEMELARSTLPGISIAYNYLGLVLETLQQTEAAIEAYSKATQLNPRFVSAWENLIDANARLEAKKYHNAANLSQAEIQELSEMNFVMDNVDISDQPQSDNLLPGWYYLDESAYHIPGTPGYRIRPGRSGYDQLDTAFELARLQGIVIKRVFTGKFRTKNPLDLFTMIILGLVYCFPIIGIPIGVWGTLIIGFPYWLVGVAFLVNVIMSIRSQENSEDEQVFY